MFDVPPTERAELRWQAEVPIEDPAHPWNVGLIVGPSGAGKTQCARALFGKAVDRKLKWGGAGVIDDFAAGKTIQEITQSCQAVGFNTIPSWLRPYAVLSNGERFRVELARRLLELPDPVVVDEFTSVVDRQVAKIGSHAVQKWARRQGRQFVAVSCHDDLMEWLQPDWVFEPATGHFARRSLQRRPELAISISRVPHAAWELFAPFHYLTNELHRAARCYALFVEERVAAFCGFLPRPISSGVDRGKALWGLSRLVTLPDFQGLGLAFVITDRMGAALRDLGLRMRTYPAHPQLVRSFDHSGSYRLVKRPGVFYAPTQGKLEGRGFRFGGRPNAVFEYIGPAAGDVAQSRALWEGDLPATARRKKASAPRG